MINNGLWSQAGKLQHKGLFFFLKLYIPLKAIFQFLSQNSKDRWKDKELSLLRRLSGAHAWEINGAEGEGNKKHCEKLYYNKAKREKKRKKLSPFLQRK